MRARYLLGLAWTLVFTGCTTTPAPLRGHPDLLAFLAEGRTTRTEAISKLGQPSGAFEGERILTYRLGYDAQNCSFYVAEREGALSGWPTWIMAKRSLVLVFDETGVLTQHSLVEVNQ